jgi:hypothetical protein
MSYIPSATRGTMSNKVHKMGCQLMLIKKIITRIITDKKINAFLIMLMYLNAGWFY